ncbi:hypothetical protein N8I74_11610 [Chitiniphilus purpureus]|uniref:Uncharacterized protein n=1 Tax=Chitiniphilus purpureus TaxID=2981137 RepID=A0ABY6DIB1_9NEIS|nr:hypothetical protein [Chitiniphilus sp. CD1]UXY13968.1 hypothetical protein N8I74_11610 [Chitiniphilus sp. CD1]
MRFQKPVRFPKVSTAKLLLPTLNAYIRIGWIFSGALQLPSAFHYQFEIETRPSLLGATVDGWYQIVRCTRQARIPVTDWVRSQPAETVRLALDSASHQALRHIAALDVVVA